MNKLEKFLMPLADVLTKNRVLIAIRDGFLITTPLLIVGSIFLLIANFPIPGWARSIANGLDRMVYSGFKSIIYLYRFIDCIRYRVCHGS